MRIPRTLVLSVLLGGFSVAALTGCDVVARNTLVDGITAPGPVTEVRLDSGGSGDVTVVVNRSSTEIDVKRTVHYGGSAPAQTARVEGSVLVLGMDCGLDCSASYQVTLPAPARVTGSNSSGDVNLSDVLSVDISLSSGDVTVSRSEGPVTVTSTSGDIVVNSVSGPTMIKATSGDIKAQQISGPTNRFESTSGNIDVELSTFVDATVRATSGDITVHVPAGSAYKVQTRADSGDVHVDIPTDPNGAHTLDLSASSGDITVSPR